MLTIKQLKYLKSAAEDEVMLAWERTELMECWEKGLVSKDGTNVTKDGLSKVERFNERCRELLEGISLDRCPKDYDTELIKEGYVRGYLNGSQCWHSSVAIFWTRFPRRLKPWIGRPNEALDKMLRGGVNSYNQRAKAQLKMVPVCLQQGSPSAPSLIYFEPLTQTPNTRNTVRIAPHHFAYIQSIEEGVTYWRVVGSKQAPLLAGRTDHRDCPLTPQVENARRL